MRCIYLDRGSYDTFQGTFFILGIYPEIGYDSQIIKDGL